MLRINLLLAILSLSLLTYAGPAYAKCPEKLSDLLTRAIELNESLKTSVVKKSANYHDARKHLESYQSDCLSKAYPKIESNLVNKSDNTLLKALLDLSVSFENSADEKLSLLLAKVFRADSESFEKTFKKFSKPNREIIFGQLEFGWGNLTYQRVLSEKEIEQGKRLKALE